MPTAPSDVYRPSGRVRGTIGPSSALNQANNVSVTTTATILMSDTIVTDEVTIMLTAKGTNTTRVVIGNSTVDVNKGAYRLFNVNDFITIAHNHNQDPIYVICDHVDGATVSINYLRAF